MVHFTGMDVQDNDERTPLLLAGHFGHQSIMKTLIHLGCDISHNDGLGMNAIHYAATHGFMDVIMVRRAIQFYIYLKLSIEFD